MNKTIRPKSVILSIPLLRRTMLYNRLNDHFSPQFLSSNLTSRRPCMCRRNGPGRAACIQYKDTFTQPIVIMSINHTSNVDYCACISPAYNVSHWKLKRTNSVDYDSLSAEAYTFKCTLHVFRKKTPTYVFDYNSGVSWSIFIHFVPVEREMNNLQFTYLQSWWRHKCVTMNATKVYFIELLLNIKYIEFWIEFEDKILIKNLWKC